MCQSASRVKLILGLSSTSKVEDLWTTRLGTAYCQRSVFINRCGAVRHAELIPSVRIRIMPGRAIRTTSRIVFLLCGLVSLFTGVPYVMLRGAELPVQSESVIFAVALGAVGVFSVTVAVLPRSWIANPCKRDRDDQRLFSKPLKVLGVFALISYLVALVAYFRSPPLESRSSAHVFTVSDVFRKDDVRSVACRCPFPACTHERGGVRRSRPHVGVRTAGFP